MAGSRTALATGVVVVAALFVGSTINAALPDPNALFGTPFEHAGGIGVEITLRNAKLTVTGVEASKELERLDQVAVSEGVFLVVDVTYEPRGETSVLGSNARLVAADGREFGGRTPVSPACGPAQPGLPLACRLTLEVPPDVLAGAVLKVPAGIDTTLMDDVAVIDLGITPERASELGAASGRIVLPDETPVAG